jgi:molybdenum cofactor synthesis domain-containing protein
MRIAILTVSDRCSRGETTDMSGPAMAEIARAQLHAEVVATACLPDERSQLSEQLRHWALHDPKPDLILTTGGTGLAPRDVTPESTLDVIERRHAGLMELIRRRCYEKTPRAYLSRGEAGTLGRTLIINLPGSQRGATESLEALIDILTRPRNSLVKQYQKLFEMDDVRLKFTRPALKAIARKATERESGARGAGAILEESMLDIMYEVPSKSSVKEVVVSDDVVNKNDAPVMVYMDEAEAEPA